MKNVNLIRPWRSQAEDYPTVLSYTKKNKINLKEKHLIDLSSLSFQTSFGFENKIIQKTLSDQVKYSNVTLSKYALKLQNDTAESLVKLINLKGKVFFTLSGAESIEHAIKICRHFSGREIILSRKRSYHGATLGALQVTGDWRRDECFLPKNGHKFIYEPDEDPDFQRSLRLIKEIGPRKIAGICLETVTAKNGGHVITQTWWRELKKLQKEYGIKIILDEVVCGFYRTGKPFGFQHYNFSPDIVCMAKSISNGMAPLGAIFFSKDIAQYYDHNLFPSGLTNYAHPLSLGALRGVMKVISSKAFLKNLDSQQHHLKDWLKTIRKEVLDVRGKGSLFAIELKKTPPSNYFQRYGIHIAVNENIIILCPCLTLTVKELSKSLDTLKTAILELTECTQR